MKISATILLSVLSLLAVSGQEDGQVYCGRRLSTALALLCENGLIKRSENNFNDVKEHMFPWIPAHHARSLGRSKRQVVSECCFKPCTIEELIAYCA